MIFTIKTSALSQFKNATAPVFEKINVKGQIAHLGLVSPVGSAKVIETTGGCFSLSLLPVIIITITSADGMLNPSQKSPGYGLRRMVIPEVRQERLYQKIANLIIAYQ